MACAIQLVEAIAEKDVDEATRIFSDMMVMLRIESGRCQSLTIDHVIRTYQAP